MSATVPAILAAPLNRIRITQVDRSHFMACANGVFIPAGHGCCALDALNALLRAQPELLMEGCVVEVRP
jgi:hypothetical protein